MIVTRHDSAESFLKAASPLLMHAEAENNVIIGVAQGIARNPSGARDPYLATVSNDTGVLACGVYIAPSKMVITRANREPIVALAKDAYENVPTIEGVSGPDRSANDFALAWSKLSGMEPTLGMRLRIHETRAVERGQHSPDQRQFSRRPGNRSHLADGVDRGVCAGGGDSRKGRCLGRCRRRHSS